MTKKELQFQIDAAFAKIDELIKRINYYQGITDKTNNRLSQAELELNQRIDDLVKKQAERYRMLLDYLKVQEEEYATLTTPFKTILGDYPSEAVKRTRLVKKVK